MGEKGVLTLQQEMTAGTLIQTGFTAALEILQYNKKYDEELYVVMITLKRI
jgi:hypothetical protein